MKDEHAIINKTALLKKIEELEKANEVFRNSKTHNPTMAACEATLSTLKQILSQSTPLIPEIEKAYMQGALDFQMNGKEFTNGDEQDYISNLKINI